MPVDKSLVVPYAIIEKAYEQANMYRGKKERENREPMYYRKPGDFMSLVLADNEVKSCDNCKRLYPLKFCTNHAEFIHKPKSSFCHTFDSKIEFDITFEQLIKVLDFLYNKDKLEDFIALLKESDSDRLYSHPILKEFDLFP